MQIAHELARGFVLQDEKSQNFAWLNFLDNRSALISKAICVYLCLCIFQAFKSLEFDGRLSSIVEVFSGNGISDKHSQRVEDVFWQFEGWMRMKNYEEAYKQLCAKGEHYKKITVNIAQDKLLKANEVSMAWPVCCIN